LSKLVHFHVGLSQPGSEVSHHRTQRLKMQASLNHVNKREKRITIGYRHYSQYPGCTRF